MPIAVARCGIGKIRFSLGPRTPRTRESYRINNEFKDGPKKLRPKWCPLRPLDVFCLVGTTGFEPATPASRTLCSTRLSHVPTWLSSYVSRFELSMKISGIYRSNRVSSSGKGVGDHDGFIAPRSDRNDLDGRAGQRFNSFKICLNIFRQLIVIFYN